METNSSGAQVLRDVFDFLGRFVVYPSTDAQIAHTLWIAHTHAMGAWHSTPRIAFLSPEPGSGKSRALEAMELLVPNPVEAVNVSPAYLFRKVAQDGARPTILFDEIDTIFGPRAKENEEIRGLINAGHRRHAVAGRCVVRGKEVVTEELPAYAAVALAGLGELPDTILTRSIVIRMRRRKPSESVEPYRRREHEAAAAMLHARLARWCAAQEPTLRDAWPTMPAGIADRDADVCEALFAIADAAGEEWPSLARASLVTLVTAAKERTPSLGVRLLADLRDLFSGSDAMTTEIILTNLIALDESPWGDLRGKPLDARGLARRLAPYDVKPRTVRIGSVTAKGYSRTDLHDAWQRYLPPQGDKSVTSVTSDTAKAACGSPRDGCDGGCPSHGAHPSHEDPCPIGVVTHVTDVTDSAADARADDAS